MKECIGIRREDKNRWERRVPLVPEEVERLCKKGVRVLVQPSPIRAFDDESYRRAGAEISEDLSSCSLVLAVKEIPISLFRPGQAYLYFAHVIKGQPHNMPMLKKLLELGCTLMDYEKITDEKGKRLVFFGRHAGLAGMQDTLWALGQRLKTEGLNTPFASLQPAHAYRDLQHLLEAVEETGRAIARDGVPPALRPMVFGFTGYGNVSGGAQEVFDRLPHVEIKPEQLDSLDRRQSLPVKVVFREEHMVEPAQPGLTFVLQNYYNHPENYRGVFARYLPHISVLVNCIYWAPRYPRLVTRADLKQLWSRGEPRLKVIGDISCDIEGSIECTLTCTTPDEPVFVYDVEQEKVRPGVQGRGPVVLAVDNLPCEIPVESSRDFSRALSPYTEALARADYSMPAEKLGLPAEMMRALIVHRGKLTPAFEYLKTHVEKHG